MHNDSDLSEFTKKIINNDSDDTTLRLDSFGYRTNTREIEKAGATRRGTTASSDPSDDDSVCNLVLGLGPTCSNDSTSPPMLQLGLSRGTDVISHTLKISDSAQNPFNRLAGQFPDEGSSSTKRSIGCIEKLRPAPAKGNTVISSLSRSRYEAPKPSSEPSAFSSSEPAGSLITSISSDTRKNPNNANKQCIFRGCTQQLIITSSGGGQNGPRSARSNLGETGKLLGSIGPGLFRGLVIPCGKGSLGNTTSGSSVLSDSYRDERPNKRRGLIPPQVLVPLSMKQQASSSGFSDDGVDEVGSVSGPEGRVHGGALLSLLPRDDDDEDRS